MYKLIVSDLDGTLLSSDMQVSEKNEAAIKEFSKRGITFSVSSGRTLYEIPKCVRENPYIRYIAYSNGTAVYDKEKKCDIISNRISRDGTNKAFDILKKYDTLFLVHIEGHAYFDKSKTADEVFKKYQVNDYYRAVLLNTVMTENLEKLARAADGVEAVVLFFSDDGDIERCKAELEGVSGISITSSVAHNIELCSSKAGKGAALAELAHILDISRSEIIAVGDGMNDSSMLDYSEIFLCAENGNEAIRKIASDVVCSNDEDIADYILKHYIK